MRSLRAIMLAIELRLPVTDEEIECIEEYIKQRKASPSKAFIFMLKLLGILALLEAWLIWYF